ncbi:MULTISPECIES: hypothetical protein [unclassified Polaromonas]|nr:MULTISPECIES: hypothetical protein [unclassified Polaromonas]MBG6073786.1 hypothetical protein [Polaromonas sp. CG_9.7]MBG6115770.1 hypothetical protein [Polaromonas sp. CG_9.2]
MAALLAPLLSIVTFSGTRPQGNSPEPLGGVAGRDKWPDCARPVAA